MGLIASLFEFRSDTSNLANPKQWLIDYFGGGGQSKTGISVTPDSAMRASAVYSCVRIISEIVGCTPCILYQNDGEESRKRARNHPIYDLLHLRPNRWQTPLEFKEMMTGHLCLRGNAYAHIQMVSVPNGIVLELVPLHPDRVFPSILNDRIVGYEYSPLQGSPASYATGEIMHLRGLSSDGLMGMSPITAHQEAIGLSLAAEEHASRIFANGAGIRGVLQTDAVLKPDAFERLKTQFSDIYSGLRNVGKTAILESGVKWQAIGMTSKDAEFLELRQFQVDDIDRIFFPHLKLSKNQATLSNVEQQAISFLTFTMLGWFERWEQAISRDLLSPIEQTRYFAEFLYENLLRGDIKSRYDAYAVARQWGWMSADDVRGKENMNPLESDQGKIYLSPMNMVPSDQIGKVLPAAAPPSGPASSPAAPARNLPAIRALLLDAAKRIVAKEVFGLRKLCKKPEAQVIEAFYFRNNSSFREILDPVVKAAALTELSVETDALWHGMHQVEELRGLFEAQPMAELPHAIEKCLDDWTELKPEEMTAEWMKTLEVTQ